MDLFINPQVKRNNFRLFLLDVSFFKKNAYICLRQ